MNNGTREPKGCRKGKNCERYHPKMCPSSINHSECLNENCGLYHVKGTCRLNSQPRSGDQPRRNHREPWEQSRRNHWDAHEQSRRSHQDAREQPRRRQWDSHAVRTESTNLQSQQAFQQDFLEILNVLKREIVEAIRTPPHKTLQNPITVGSHQNPPVTHYPPQGFPPPRY